MFANQGDVVAGILCKFIICLDSGAVCMSVYEVILHDAYGRCFQ